MFKSIVSDYKSVGKVNNSVGKDYKCVGRVYKALNNEINTWSLLRGFSPITGGSGT